MIKEKLKTGMIVVTRAGKIGLIFNDIISGLDWWNPLSFYGDDLKTFRYKFEGEASYNRGSEGDIVEVYTIKSVGITLNTLLTKEKIKEYGKLFWKEE